MAWFKSLYTELHAGTFLQSSTKSTGRYLVLETVRNDEMMLVGREIQTTVREVSVQLLKYRK